ncbi:MAG: hypothetical protein M1827_004762 [Pycnora praestabilis]|nr:MAG: hypothetical protein M1827_004762 [Pycnora praestabilis]
MSNYPPTPSFGLPFSFAAQAPSSSSTAPRQMPPLNPRQEYRSPNTSLPGPPPVAPFAQTLNAFQRNANLPGLNFQQFRADLLPPPPLPTPGQYSNGSLLPPPYPPLPIPSQSFPAQKSQPIAEHTFTTAQLPPPPLLPTKPVDTPISTNNMMGRPVGHLAPHPDREEGELSDIDIGDMPQASTTSKEPTCFVPTSHDWLEEKHLGNESSFQSPITERREYLGPQYQGQRNNQARRYPFQHRNDRRSPAPHQSSGLEDYDHWSPSAVPRYNRDNTRDDRASNSHINEPKDFRSGCISPSIQIITSHNSTDRQSSYQARSIRTLDQQSLEYSKSKTTSSAERYSPTVGKAPSEVRTLAKNALLNLLPYKFKLSDFVAEQVDESILRGLYEEIRVRVTPPPLGRMAAEEMGQKISLPVTKQHEIDAIEAGIQTSTSSQSQQPKESTSVPVKPAGMPLNTQNASIERPAENLPQHNQKGASSSAQASQPPKVAPYVSLSNPVVGKPFNEGTALKRNEIIARRFGRPVPSVDNLEAFQPAPEQVTSPLPESARSVEVMSKIEDNKKIQTELARQRMEELEKKNAVAAKDKRSSELTDSTVSNAPSMQQAKAKPQGSSISLKSSSNGSAYPHSHNVPLVDEVVPLASQNTKSVSIPAVMIKHSGIPGLFMTSSPATEIPIPSSSPKMDKPVTATQETSVVRKKRPVASDFDSPSGITFKRPFGQSRADSVFIDVSDDETEDDFADSDMDLDQAETSDRSGSAQQGHGNEKHKSIRDLPPLSDFPIRRNPIQNGTSTPGSALNIPLLTHIPGKSSEQENLKKKEEQIQFMQRKIAELEQRRKAKQTVSRAQTPGTPGRASSASRADPGTNSSVEATEASVDIEEMIETASRQVNEDKVNLAKAKAAEQKRIESEEQTKFATREAKGPEQAKTLEREQEIAEGLERAKVASEKNKNAEEMDKAKAAVLEKLKAKARTAMLEKAAKAKAEAEAKEVEEEKVAADQKKIVDEQDRLRVTTAKRFKRKADVEADLATFDAELTQVRKKREQIVEDRRISDLRFEDEERRLGIEIQQREEGRKAVFEELKSLVDIIARMPFEANETSKEKIFEPREADIEDAQREVHVRQDSPGKPTAEPSTVFSKEHNIQSLPVVEIASPTLSSLSPSQAVGAESNRTVSRLSIQSFERDRQESVVPDLDKGAQEYSNINETSKPSTDQASDVPIHQDETTENFMDDSDSGEEEGEIAEAVDEAVDDEQSTQPSGSMSAEEDLQAALQDAAAQGEAKAQSTERVDEEMAYASAPDQGNLPIQEAIELSAQHEELPSLKALADEEVDNSEQEEGEIDDSSSSSKDSDDYEPPDATPPAANEEVVAESPPFSPAPPEVFSISNNAIHVHPLVADHANAPLREVAREISKDLVAAFPHGVCQVCLLKFTR